MPVKNIAKYIRLLTSPPVLAAWMFLSLRSCSQGMTLSGQDIAVSVLCICLIPTASPLLARLIPTFREDGHAGKRKADFCCSLAGYGAAYVYGLAGNVSKDLFLIYEAYFFSVLILIGVNCFLNIRASGHACGITGPMIIVSCFAGLHAALPYVILFGACAWASIDRERHTYPEFLLGSTCAVIGFSIAWLWHLFLPAWSAFF